MFWSRKKKDSKEATQASEPGPVGSIAASVGETVVPVQQDSSLRSDPVRESSASAIEQLIDLDELRPTEEPLHPAAHSTEPLQPSSAETQTVPSPVPVAIRYHQFGEIVSLLLKSPTYQRAALQDLEWLVLPPLRLGQISIAKAPVAGSDTPVPIGTVIWARVSEEIDHRLSTELNKPIRLSQSDWNCGSVLWIVATVGEARVVRALIDRVIQGNDLGPRAKVRTRTPEGAVKVLNYTLGSQA